MWDIGPVQQSTVSLPDPLPDDPLPPAEEGQTTMTYRYVLRLPDGSQQTVSGIAQEPAAYALLLPVGWSIVTATPETPAGGSYPVYRLILPVSAGRVDTGGTYPGCTIEHPELCDGKQFADVPAAFDYAEAHGETPVLVASVEEAYAIADAEDRARRLQEQYTGPSASPRPTTTPNPSPLPTTVSDNLPLILGAGLLVLMLAKKR